MRLILGALLVSVSTALGVAVGVSSPAGADPLPLPTSPFGEPTGANDWDCLPTAQRPEPVIIVHGTFGDRKSLLDHLSAAMVDEGFCVFSLDYGNRGTGDIVASAKVLKKFTTKVLDATGAAKVSMVGHSQGGMMPRYYIKFLGGAAVVDDLVGLSPSNHGTTITGDDSNPLTGGFCRACSQQAAGSAFLTKLNKGDETPGAVSYTQISTRYDEVVVPYTSAFLAAGPRTTNLTIQDACPGDAAEHVFIPMSSTAIAYVLDALTHDGPADPAYQPACGTGLPGA
ncbi:MULTISPECIES: esterase/lipase family protein [unclassified Nocardioides]|uniref:esterase/lipase family protein n=1 Tax=unclassified Nocardioides TaxID=2615069 RepID=UPI0009F13B7E|nr:MULTISPECIES: alpha/beta fold hydrolase [unclassified Nocardioides]GAW50940.1 lipase, class 2 [Nocardioides sp. PD653-B2]GAW56333.1 lipase, class 2 [Nocardioides sp. PD653]